MLERSQLMNSTVHMTGSLMLTYSSAMIGGSLGNCELIEAGAIGAADMLRRLILPEVKVLCFFLVREATSFAEKDAILVYLPGVARSLV